MVEDDAFKGESSADLLFRVVERGACAIQHLLQEVLGRMARLREATD